MAELMGGRVEEEMVKRMRAEVMEGETGRKLTRTKNPTPLADGVEDF